MMKRVIEFERMCKTTDFDIEKREWDRECGGGKKLKYGSVPF